MIRKDGSGSFLMVSKASVFFSGPALISDLCQIPAPTICKISPAPNGSNPWRMGLQRPKIVNPSGGVDGSGVHFIRFFRKKRRIYDFRWVCQPWLSVIAVWWWMYWGGEIEGNSGLKFARYRSFRSCQLCQCIRTLSRVITWYLKASSIYYIVNFSYFHFLPFAIILIKLALLAL